MRRAGLAVLAVAALATTARADTAADLFKQGRALMGAGKFDEACKKFQASLALDAAIGTKLNLADCLEHKGEPLEAYRLFDAVAVEATTSQEGREGYARKRADALLPKLVKVELSVARPPAPGTAVTVGGTGVAADAWSRPQIFAPGRIVVDATAPDRKPFRRVVEGRAGLAVKIDVPVLAPIESGKVVEPPRRSRRWAYITAGAGGGLLVGSLLLGLRARSIYQDADCGPPLHAEGECSDEGQAETDRARRYADAGTVTAIVGLAAVTTGVILFVRARRADRAVVAPGVTADGGAGVVITGRW